MQMIKRLPYLVSLIVALLALSAPAAQAAPVAGQSDTATITVYAHNAALGQPAEVQWGDGVGQSAAATATAQDGLAGAARAL